MMFNYTICFIKKGNKLLLLNRDSDPAKGLWNGVGGKIEKDESPFMCILREVLEETGIELEDVKYKGIVSWNINAMYSGGMYTFIAELSNDYEYLTPRRIDEGILDWKEIEWILSEDNFGVGEMIPHFLPLLLGSHDNFEHKCILVNNKLINYNAVPLVSKLQEYSGSGMQKR